METFVNTKIEKSTENPMYPPPSLNHHQFIIYPTLIRTLILPLPTLFQKKKNPSHLIILVIYSTACMAKIRSFMKNITAIPLSYLKR